MGLLSDIESSATNSEVPVVDLLRKCKVLAARLKHKELADWINTELNGYPDTASIPSYRCLTLPSPIGHFSGPFGRALNNVPIPVSLFPEDVQEAVSKAKMIQPIAEIEDLAKSSKGRLESPWSGDVIAVAQRTTIYENMVLMAASSKVPAAMLLGIVDTVRTKVLDYVLAIQATNPQADEATPAGPAPIPPATLHQTFHTTIIGQANVGGHGSQSISGNNTSNVALSQITNAHDKTTLALLNQLIEGSKKLRDHDKNEATYALDKVQDQLKNKTPNLDRIKGYLDIAGNLVNLAPVAQKLYSHLAQLLS